MALTINTHAMLTIGVSASTTGTLTASPGDLAILAFYTSTGGTVPTGTASGGGLSWSAVFDTTVSSTRAQIIIAKVNAIVTAQTITITVPNATTIVGSIIAVSGGVGIGATSLGQNIGAASVTRTLNIRNNGSIVLGIFNASDTVYTAPAAALDNDGTRFSGSAGVASYASGATATMIATSAGSNLAGTLAYEVMSAGTKLNNSGLRPHPFSPGLAR